MSHEKAKQAVKELLGLAGIQLNGYHPWDVRVYNDKLYKAILMDGSIGAGESYVKKWWDCPQLDEMFARILTPAFEEKIHKNWKAFSTLILSKLFNVQPRSHGFEIARHYDLGNELFRKMLDK